MAAITLYNGYKPMHRDIQYQIVNPPVGKASSEAFDPRHGYARLATQPGRALDAVCNCQLHVPRPAPQA
jgi:hypothetical protein